MAPCARFNLPTPQRAPTAPGVGTLPTWPQAIWKSPPKTLTKRPALPWCTVYTVRTDMRKVTLSHTYKHTHGATRTTPSARRCFACTHAYLHKLLKTQRSNCNGSVCRTTMLKYTYATHTLRCFRRPRWHEMKNPCCCPCWHTCWHVHAYTHSLFHTSKVGALSLKCRWVRCLSWGHPSGLMKLADPDTVSLGRTAGAAS